MENKYKAVIFDLDGTLLDTLEDLKNSVNESLKINGYNVSYTYEEAKWLIGNGTKRLCELSIEKFNPTEEENRKVFEDFTRLYRIKQLENTVPYPHVKELLFSLKEEGIKVCVLSNKTEENVKEILSSLFPNYHFDFVVGQRKDVPKKPDPYCLNKMIKDLQIDKKEILYVGDSDVDMIVSNNVNLDNVAVSYGYRPREMLKQYNPKYIVDDIIEILEIIKNK